MLLALMKIILVDTRDFCLLYPSMRLYNVGHLHMNILYIYMFTANEHTVLDYIKEVNWS